MAKGSRAYVIYVNASVIGSNYVAYPQLAVVLDGVFVILFHVVGEVVDWDVIVFDILHDLS